MQRSGAQTHNLDAGKGIPPRGSMDPRRRALAADESTRGEPRMAVEAGEIGCRGIHNRKGLSMTPRAVESI